MTKYGCPVVSVPASNTFAIHRWLIAAKARCSSWNLAIASLLATPIARQTFKEITPILNQEYLGGPIFIGNPELKMSSVENYDLRLDESVLDLDACRDAGVDVVRRRSGGGAVLLVPGEMTWIDVIVPTGTVGWSDDIHGAMVWLGRHLAEVIVAVAGAEDVVVHDGAMQSTPWSKTICFDGLGAGEVVVGGRKLVGLSQRRTRHAARLQCCWYSVYDPTRLVELLASDRRPPLGELSSPATMSAVTSDAVVDALVSRLR